MSMHDGHKAIITALNSKDDIFANKTREERIKMSLAETYDKIQADIETRRAIQMISLSVNSDDKDLIRYFIESNPGEEYSSVLKTKDLFESFVNEMMSDVPMNGVISRIECIDHFGSCVIGNVYCGRWVQSTKADHLKLDLSESMPNLKSYPNIFYDKTIKQMNTQKQFKLL